MQIDKHTKHEMLLKCNTKASIINTIVHTWVLVVKY